MDIMSYLMGQNNAIKKGMKVEVVTELPDTGVANVIYLVPKEDTGDNDIFDEYLWIDDNWEHIGSTDIDLSNYYTKSEVDSKLAPYYELHVTNTYWPAQGSLTGDNINGKIGNIITDAYSKGYEHILLNVISSSVTSVNVLFIAQMWKASNKPVSIQFYGITPGQRYNKSDNYGLTSFGLDTKQLMLNLSWNGDVCTCIANTFFASLAQVLTADNEHSYTPTKNYHPATKKYVDDITGALSNLATTDKTSLVNAINEVLAGSGGDSEAVKVLYLDDYSSSSNALDMSKFETGLYIILRKREGNTMYMKPRASASARGLQNATGFNNLTLLLYSNQLPETYDSNARGLTIFQLNPNSFGYWVYTDYNTYFDAAWNTVVESVSVANNQTITGTKIFSTLPVSSVTPTFNNQLVNKQYVDDSIASAITDALGGSY